MYLKSLATKLLLDNSPAANESSEAEIESALGELLGGTGEFDLTDIVWKFVNSSPSISAKAKSWLGDGSNEPISSAEVEEVLGSNKIAELANRLGIPQKEISEGLSKMLPQIIDVASRGGSLFYSVQGNRKSNLGRLAGFASRLFG